MMKSGDSTRAQRIGMAVAVAAALLATAPLANAANAAWDGSSSAVWANGDNWTPASVPGTGDTATFNNAGNGNTTLDLGGGVTIKTLLFDTASAASYTVGSGGNNAQTLTLNNNAAVAVNATVTAGQLFRAALVLGTDGATQTSTFTIGGGNLQLYGDIAGSTGAGTKTLVLTSTLAAGNAPYLPCAIADGGGGGKVAVTRQGPGSSVWSAAHTFSGPLKLSNGDVRLQDGGSVLNVTDLTLGGVAADTFLILRDDTANIARLNSSVAVTALGNSYLDLRGDAGSSSAQTIGTYSSQGGVNVIRPILANQGGSATDAMPVWQIADLLHPGGGVVTLAGAAVNSLGRKNNYNLGQGSGAGYAQVKATQIAGASPASALVNQIVPWVFIGNGLSSISAFATYGANGFKPYGYDATGAVNNNGGAEPYVTTLAAAGASDNVLLTSTEGVSGTKTINSLNTAVDVTGSSANTLVLASGALLVRGGHISPRISLNGQEGIVYATGVNMEMSGGLHNDGGNGVVFADDGQNLGDGIFLNAASTYTGPTRIHKGLLVPRNTANAIPTTSAVRVDAGGSLCLWDSGGRTIGALSGAGKVTARNPGSSSSTLTIGSGDGSGDFSGVIDNGFAGSIALSKTGSGVQTLSGVNTYAGATAVEGGGLFVNGSIAGTAVTAADDTTLGGAGTIAGATTLAAGATLAPGAADATGTLTLNSDLLMNSGSALSVNIRGDNSFDKVAVTGSTVSLDADGGGAGTTLQVALGYAPSGNQRFTILDKQSPGSIAGAFSNGDTITATYNGHDYTFAINTAGGTGNDVVLTLLSGGTVMFVR